MWISTNSIYYKFLKLFKKKINFKKDCFLYNVGDLIANKKE